MPHVMPFQSSPLSNMVSTPNQDPQGRRHRKILRLIVRLPMKGQSFARILQLLCIPRLDLPPAAQSTGTKPP